MSIDQLRDVKLITALITPFHEDGSINYDALPDLIEHLLAHHTEALLLAGTTAESPTLTHDEELELFAAVQKIVNGRVPLIAGVGTNDTRDSIEFAKEVAKFGGFAAGLAIVPYYNKPSQEGMYQHFKAIADASDLPIIIYNIPGRVVVEMTPDTMLRLAEHPNIIGVKECTSLANMAYLIEHKPEDFLVYTGEDGDAFHAMNLGANGVISVASHTMVMRCMPCLKLLKIVTSRRQQLSNVDSFLKLTLSSQYQVLHLSRLFSTILVWKLGHFVCHWLHVLQKKLNVS